MIAIISITLLAPGGLLDKADKVGYAVCHRITIRSFLIGERQMPLCAGAAPGNTWARLPACSTCSCGDGHEPVRVRHRPC